MYIKKHQNMYIRIQKHQEPQNQLCEFRLGHTKLSLHGLMVKHSKPVTVSHTLQHPSATPRPGDELRTGTPSVRTLATPWVPRSACRSRDQRCNLGQYQK
ncbi:hypothetical protein ABZP36_000853 [Zizania latifolia]